jgi:valyl-tRNA synthetase
VLDTCLRLLHPYMPYVTEEIWSGSGELRRHLAGTENEMLLTAEFPRVTNVWQDEEAEREMTLVLDIVRAIRNLRRERGLDAGRWLEAYVVADIALLRHAPAIEALARVRPLHIVANRNAAPSEAVATTILANAQVILPLAGLFDIAAERDKLEKQRDETEKQIEALEAQLSKDSFTARAPANVVAEVRERLTAAQSRLAGIEARLRELD